MAGSNLRRYNTKPGRKLDLCGLYVIDPVNNRFAAAVDHINYGLLNKSSRYDDNVANELYKMTTKVTEKMKDSSYSSKDLMSKFSFSKNSCPHLLQL